MDMPLPPIKGIVPRVVAEWNAVKGGSDADEEFVNTCFLNVHNRAFNEHFQRMDVKKRRV